MQDVAYYVGIVVRVYGIVWRGLRVVGFGYMGVRYWQGWAVLGALLYLDV